MRIPRLALGWALALLVGASCARVPPEPVAEEAWTASSEAEARIAAAVAAHGLTDPEDLQIRFGFRGVPYVLQLDGRRAVYRRTVPTPVGPREDRLEGSAFVARQGGVPLPLGAAESGALRRSLNSVAWFALLPRALQDEAVIASSLGRTTLRGQPLDAIEVRFREASGGEDHDDVFRFWLHPDSHRLAYLAYRFERGEGGVRVREAIGAHEVAGPDGRQVVLLDWANHGVDGERSLAAAIADFERGELPHISDIRLEEVRVEAASAGDMNEGR